MDSSNLKADLPGRRYFFQEAVFFPPSGRLVICGPPSAKGGGTEPSPSFHSLQRVRFFPSPWNQQPAKECLLPSSLEAYNEFPFLPFSLRAPRQEGAFFFFFFLANVVQIPLPFLARRPVAVPFLAYQSQGWWAAWLPFSFPRT